MDSGARRVPVGFPDYFTSLRAQGEPGEPAKAAVIITCRARGVHLTSKEHACSRALRYHSWK